MSQRRAIIIGAGPAGLTAAYELLEQTDVQPIVLEASNTVGGLAQTVNYKGNRIDIGGHRFFSKVDRVMDWWRKQMPLQGAPARDEILLTQQGGPGEVREPQLTPNGPDPEKKDVVMLIRHRLSRIFFMRKFFSYPIALSWETLSNLGMVRLAKIGCSYVAASLKPIKPEKSLEDFLINRFGRQLYATFFEDYTQKVWGVPCRTIKPEWGAQRIKGLSITKAVLHALKRMLPSKEGGVAQKKTETSLIERFMYPKHGPGQMWELVTEQVRNRGGEVHLRQKVLGLTLENGRITAARVRDETTGTEKTWTGDFFFSTMPIRELIAGLQGPVPDDAKEVAAGLVYRDFITVGVLLRKLRIRNTTKLKTLHNLVPDNWIYIQEPEVRVGRLQIFNNWSPYMVADINNAWVGMEYFCNIGDDLWSKEDEEFKRFAVAELASIDIIDPADVLDTVIIRMPYTYPAYFGSYDRFHVLREFVDSIENLFLIGRNGMHRYNNQDHSMMTAITAVENIARGITTKDNIWAVNVEKEYHEEKK